MGPTTRRLNWTVVTHPSGEHRPQLCEGGHTYVSKYSYLGLQNPVMTWQNRSMGEFTSNAMNQHGFAVSTHAFRSNGDYNPPNTTLQICEQNFGEWAVASFASIAEMRSALPNVAVDVTDTPSTASPGLMWAIADATGESVVVDYFHGELRINNNYAALSNHWPDTGFGRFSTVVGQVPEPVGNGFNLMGIPGDFSPPSRFVRAFFLREFALAARPPSNLDQAIVIATGVLNGVHIVQGLNALETPQSGWDFTQFAVLKVPAERLLYFRTYENMQWRKIDMKLVDFSVSKTLPMSYAYPPIRDVTSDFS